MKLMEGRGAPHVITPTVDMDGPGNSQWGGLEEARIWDKKYLGQVTQLRDQAGLQYFREGGQQTRYAIWLCTLKTCDALVSN